MPEKSKAIARVLPPIEPEFPLLSADSAREAAELLQQNHLGAIQVPDLPRIKCGSGGSLNYLVATPDGEQSEKTLSAIVINRRPGRVYWKGEAKSKRPPDCSSKDGLMGVGSPGGACAGCPMSQFGSAVKGHGQACKQIQQMLILLPGELLPHVISVPPTSLKPCNQYFLGLLSRRIPYWFVITRMALERSTNEDGQEYAKLTFSVERYMTDEERQVFAPMQREMKRLLDPVTLTVDDFSVASGEEPLVSQPRHRTGPTDANPEGPADGDVPF